MSNNKIKAIIFDVDGVLFKNHDEQGRYIWSKNAKQDLGLTREHFTCIYHNDMDVITGKRTKIEYLTDIFQTNPLFKELAISADDYVAYWLEHDTGVCPFMIELVQQINQLIPCYLGTNQEELRANHIMSLIGQYFLNCFASYAIGFIKPEKGFFQHIEKALSLLPHELLLIDDTKNNTLGAQDCGWHVYHYQNDIEGLMDFLKKYEVMDG